MTRSISSTSQAATSQHHTRPIYLIYMGWDVASPLPTYLRIATWDTAIPWDSESWVASGAEIQGISANGGRLELPMGDDDPWLGLVQTQRARGRAITVYEYHTDFTVSPHASDAVQVFSGVMDGAEISPDKIRISLIESATNKVFPPTSLGPPTYNHLPPKGLRVFWGPDIVTVG